MNVNDGFESLFAPDPNSQQDSVAPEPWKILLVDDETDIHAVLRLALQDMVVEGRPMQLLDACSAAEAADLLAENPDTALILLDVVMEKGQAGLELVNKIRNDLNNSRVQIIILTGQPGYAPRRDVIEHYDINGYLLKNDLNGDKIFTAVYTSLRAFQALAERKKVEEEKLNLEKLTWQLQKNQSLNRMAGAIAHHFNNHLGAAIGNLEMVIDDLPAESEMSRRLSGAMEAVLRSTRVSDQLLSYLGQITGENLESNLTETCRRILLLLQAAAPKNLEFKVDLQQPGPVIKARAGQLEQVVTNLVNNAFEAIGDNQGTVRLKVKTVAPDDISATRFYPVSWRPGDTNLACIEVSDTGCGIGKEAVDKLFDPFYSTKFVGRGLGLSTAFGIVKAHGGAFTVTSTIGQGSTFRVLLPTSSSVSADTRMQLQEKPAQQETETLVLLVEDEEMVRDMIHAMLTRLGFRVIAATDGVEALELFSTKTDAVDVVLCDLSMPRMNGWQTVAALREVRPTLPVVLISGYDQVKAAEGGSREGAQVILQKPFLKSELKEAIHEVLAMVPPSGDK